MEHCRSFNGPGWKFARVPEVINADGFSQRDVIASCQATELRQASVEIYTEIATNFRSQPSSPLCTNETLASFVENYFPGRFDKTMRKIFNEMEKIREFKHDPASIWYKFHFIRRKSRGKESWHESDFLFVATFLPSLARHLLFRHFSLEQRTLAFDRLAAPVFAIFTPRSSAFHSASFSPLTIACSEHLVDNVSQSLLDGEVCQKRAERVCLNSCSRGEWRRKDRIESRVRCRFLSFELASLVYLLSFRSLINFLRQILARIPFHSLRVERGQRAELSPRERNVRL